MAYLLDASALYPLVLKLREGFLLHAREFVVLDLTVYEVGNVLWKEYRVGRITSLDVVLALFQEVFRVLRKLSINSLAKVLGVAVNLNLTFYDAAYLYAARENRLTLVTEDRKLLGKAQEAGVKAVTVETLAKHLSKGRVKQP